MNIANKITIVRILLAPVFMWLLLSNHPLLAAAVFIIASCTDWLDGYLARKKDIITSFGKIMDPLADKILVVGALLCLVEMDTVPAWAAMLIIARELLVTSLRVVAMSKGNVIAASMWGKVKTVVQIAAVTVAIVLGNSIYSRTAIYIAVLVTVVSGIVYVITNRAVFKD